MIVENDPLLRWSFQSVLSKSGFRILTAVTVEKALEFFRTTPINAVLADENYPEVESLKILKELRLVSHSIPLIIIGTDVKMTGHDKGLSQVVYHEKPAELDDIVELAEGLRDTLIQNMEMEKSANPGENSHE